MGSVTAAFQFASLLVFMATLALAIYGLAQQSRYRLAFVPPLLWSGFGVVYYTALLAGRLTPDELLLWGSVHRFMAGAGAFGATATLVVFLRTKGDE